MSSKIEQKLRKQLAEFNDNKKRAYKWQIVFLFLNWLCFLKDISQINILALSLYAVPIIIDLANENMKNIGFKVFKYTILVINVLFIGIVMALSFTGLVLDYKTYFEIIPTAYWFANKKIDKGILLVIMLMDIFIPVVLSFATIDNKDVVVEAAGKTRNKKEDATC